RELFEQAIAYAFQDKVAAWGRQQHAVFDHPYIARRAFRQMTIAELHDFVDARLDGLLLGQHVAQQGNRLDLTAQPADVGDADYAEALFARGAAGPGKWRNHAENRGGRILGETVIPFRHTPRDLDVNHAVAQAGALDQILDDLLPVAAPKTYLDVDSGEAALETGQVTVHAKGLAVIGRHHIINTIAKNESAIKHGDFGIFQPNIVAIQVNDTIAINIGNHYFEPYYYSNIKRTLSYIRPKNPASWTSSNMYKGSWRSNFPSSDK